MHGQQNVKIWIYLINLNSVERKNNLQADGRLYPSFRQLIYHFITHNPTVILHPSEVYVLLKVFQPLNR